MDNCEILQQDIQSLLEYFSKVLYKAKDCENGSMVSKNEENICVCHVHSVHTTHTCKPTKRNSLCLFVLFFELKNKMWIGRRRAVLRRISGQEITKSAEKWRRFRWNSTTLAYFSRSDIMITVLADWHSCSGYSSRVTYMCVCVCIHRVLLRRLCVYVFVDVII